MPIIIDDTDNLEALNNFNNYFYFLNDKPSTADYFISTLHLPYK